MPAKPSALLDIRVIYCGDNLDQLRKLPEALVYIDPPFNSNRNYEVFWGETKEKRSFADRHESTKSYIDYMRPRGFEPIYWCYRICDDWNMSSLTSILRDEP